MRGSLRQSDSIGAQKRTRIRLAEGGQLLDLLDHFVSEGAQRSLGVDVKLGHALAFADLDRGPARRNRP